MGNHSSHTGGNHASHAQTGSEHGSHGDAGAKHGSVGHNHHKMMIEDFKRRFWVSLALTLPILLLSPMIQSWIGIEVRFTGNNYVLSALSSVIFFYGGWPFLKGLVRELKEKSPGMMTLISVAVCAAYFYSTAVIFGFEGKTFYWELATLIDVMLVGHWLEMRSVLGASKALEALAALMPNEANLIEGSKTKKVSIQTLKINDLILVKPGEKVPVDGVIEEGESDLNESMLTGESLPVRKGLNETVIGGAINGSGAIKVRVNGIAENSYLSKVIKMVQNAQMQKSKTQKLADVAAKWLTVIALTFGIGTFIVWLVLGKELSFAMERMVTVMVICCPHALGLAIPLVGAIATSISAKNGLLIRNRTAFENSRKISIVVFDKTGTLTEGSHKVVRIVSLKTSLTETDVLSLATSVESLSEHHIATGLKKKASEEALDIPAVSNFNYQAGIGVSGIVEGQAIQAGGFLLLRQMGIEAPFDGDHIDSTETKIFILLENELIGFITFADQIRDSSYEAIRLLQANKIKCMLLTGDNQKVAKSVAKTLQLNDYMAEVLPEQKQEKVKELQQRDEFVAMTGDGVNDAPALAQADVGIAIGSGTDVAAETADIVLVNSDPKDIAKLILFGKATHRKMIQNLVWATGYNVIALPLATGFIPGLIISPAFGAALMAISTIICAGNAQLLKRQMDTL